MEGTQARARVLPVHHPHAGTGLTSTGHAPAHRPSRRSGRSAGAQRLDRGAVRPRQHRPHRGRAARLPGGHTDTGASGERDAAKRRLADAETRLSRLRAAIEAGADPAALIESLNAAQEQRVAAQAQLAAAKPDPAELSAAEVYAMVDSLGDIGASLTRANPERMQRIYKSLRLEMVYGHEEQVLDVVIKPLGGLCVCPRGELRTCPPPTSGGRDCGVVWSLVVDDRPLRQSV
jgi:hypothetical protein